MKSVFTFISSHSDTRSEEVAGKANLSKIANKTNKSTLKVGGFHVRLFAVD